MGSIILAFVSQGDLLLLIVRFILGGVLIYYGLPKVKDLKKNADDFVKMGMKPGWLLGTIVAFLEFFGGILLILGLYTEIIALGIGFEMLLGTFMKITKWEKPFTDWSYDLILFAAMALLLLLGPGAFSF